MVRANAAAHGAILAVALLLAAGPLAPRAAAAIIIDAPSEPAMETLSDGEKVNFRSGIEATEAGNLPRAQAIFEALHKAYPKSPGPDLGLAEVAVRNSDYATAQSFLTEAQNAAPNVSEVYSARARLYILLKNYDAADTQFRKALSLASGKQKLRLEYADFLSIQRNMPAKALEQYNQVISQNPGDAVAYFGRGYAFSVLNRPDQAIADLNKAQQLAPRNPLPSLTLAQLYARTGRSKEALAAVDASLKIQPKNIAAFMARGDIFQQLGQRKQALEAYDAALRIDPKSEAAMIGLGMTHQAMNNYAEANKFYRRVIANNPRQALVLNNLAWMAAEKKTDLRQAESWARKAADLAPTRADFSDTLGWVYFQEGRLDLAQDQFLAALKLREEPVIYYHLGVTEAGLGLKSRAQGYYNKALALRPGFQPALDGLKALK